MERLKKKQLNLKHRKARVRSTISGTAKRPRLTVHISNRHVSAQLINDEKHQTIAATTSVGRKEKVTITELAIAAGEDIAKKAQKAKIKSVVFDRNGRQYHGRIKALAESARKNGLEF